MDTRKLVRNVAWLRHLCALFWHWRSNCRGGEAKPKRATRPWRRKKGLRGRWGHKKTDESKKATKLQMIIGVGSIFVAIAVIKWL